MMDDDVMYKTMWDQTKDEPPLSEERIKEIADYATGRTDEMPSGRVLE